jgi:hypothetical protein
MGHGRIPRANVGAGVGSAVPALGADGTGAKQASRNLGAKIVNNKSLSLSLVSPSMIELDLDAYVKDPNLRQPTKKALCGDQVLLITAARSASTSASPTQISLYSNKRTTISSPAKSGSASHKSNLPSVGHFPPGVTQTTAFDTALGKLEIQWDPDNASQKLLMALYSV